MDPTLAYLDWNVFNKIEKKQSLGSGESAIYAEIENLILANKILTPYSNAHINDLLRGYHKSKEFIPQHLQTLERLTRNLCITQYWGHNRVTWHYRNIIEFFNTALDDLSLSHKRLTDLIDWEGPEKTIMDMRLDILRSTPLPQILSEIYKLHPVFDKIFQKIRTEKNMLAWCEDLYDFSRNAMKDYTIYKSIRSYLNQARAKLKAHSNVFSDIDKNMIDIPKQLTFDEAWEKFIPSNNVKDNPVFQKITDLYYKSDLSGYKSDDRMANLIDDAIHVFYGSQCKFFVTIDDKCYSKAIKIYRELKVPSIVVKPVEFLTTMKQKDSI